MWSIIVKVGISKQVVMDLFDGVETDLEEKVKINSKKGIANIFLQSCWNSWFNDVKNS